MFKIAFLSNFILPINRKFTVLIWYSKIVKILINSFIGALKSTHSRYKTPVNQMTYWGLFLKYYYKNIFKL
ncbi:MAG: hypothetical protein CVU08_04320 [Bacteroidetes bacterium HGW-Bacteroidetes-3]|jgi:hypothetical protein|nr:MAG: hypothetical protein CVU08_04320 [Bacteroidetes bacterium HGW-Bacteroidetes-3]